MFLIFSSQSGRNQTKCISVSFSLHFFSVAVNSEMLNCGEKNEVDRSKAAIDKARTSEKCLLFFSILKGKHNFYLFRIQHATTSSYRMLF